MAKRIQLIGLIFCMLAVASVAGHARMRSRNIQAINQQVTTNTTITANFGGYWWIRTDQDVNINITGGTATANYHQLAADTDRDYWPAYIPKDQGVNFEPGTGSPNITIIVLDQ